ncbi:hypothetical protein GCM10022631_09930 [Deinococcus rubellus]|uniref:hypothetical protein n=1 Tax=Deinococcus rubellus TaxID=1889240 RepID=UPI0031F13847
MKLTLNRAQQRYLGLVGESSPSDPEVLPVSQVTFSADALRAFRPWLAVPGHWQGGTLFGTHQGDTLHIRFIARNGYPVHPSTSDPLDVDENYLLGWSDSLTAQSHHIEWVGQWLMSPDRRLSDLSTDLAWIERAQATGLVDDLHVLVMVGWVDGQLTLRPYSYDHNLGQAQLITEGAV